MSADVRWKQRFESFDRAFALLKEVTGRNIAELSQLEQEGAIQRFEIAFELAWKVLKDYLEDGGIVIVPVTPKNVIKEAFAARILDDAQIWIDIMLDRNQLSHTYDIETFSTALQSITTRYFPAFERLHAVLLAKAAST